jgi:hypothetical protein
METWLPEAAIRALPRWAIERAVRRALRPMRCPYHGGTAWLLKFGWGPKDWEICSTCCWAFRVRAWSEVYWALVGATPHR